MAEQFALGRIGGGVSQFQSADPRVCLTSEDAVANLLVERVFGLEQNPEERSLCENLADSVDETPLRCSELEVRRERCGATWQTARGHDVRSREHEVPAVSPSPKNDGSTGDLGAAGIDVDTPQRSNDLRGGNGGRHTSQFPRPLKDVITPK